jgi:hypothetical protein
VNSKTKATGNALRWNTALSPEPVPFQLQLADETGFSVSPATSRRVAVMLCAVPVFLLGIAAIAFVLGDWRAGVVMTGCGGGLIATVTWLYRRARWRVGLVVDRDANELVIVRDRMRGTPVELARSGQPELRVHPVKLVVATTRSGAPIKYFPGFAAVVTVSTVPFVLACVRDRERIQRYAEGLPEWLPRMSAQEGPLIEGVADWRVL